MMPVTFISTTYNVVRTLHLSECKTIFVITINQMQFGQQVKSIFPRGSVTSKVQVHLTSLLVMAPVVKLMMASYHHVKLYQEKKKCEIQ